MLKTANIIHRLTTNEKSRTIVLLFLTQIRFYRDTVYILNLNHMGMAHYDFLVLGTFVVQADSFSLS
jgi:hypothetical protein